MSVFAGTEIVNDGLVYHLDAYNYKNFSGSVPTKNYLSFTPLYQSWTPSPTSSQDVKSQYLDTEIQRLYTNDGRGFTAIWWSGFSPGAEIQFSRKFSYSVYARGIGTATAYVHQASTLPNNAMQVGGSSSSVVLNSSTWQRLFITDLYTSNTTSAQSILVGLSSGIGNYIEVKNAQFEYQDTPTEYINGSRLTVPDLSNNGNTTTFTATPYYTTNSLGINTTFAGTVLNNSISGISDGSSNFTISGWVRYDSSNNYTAWFEKQNGFVGNRLDLGYIRSSNIVYFTGWNSSGNIINEQATGYSLTADTWVNFVFACSENSSRCFINGSLVAENSVTTNFPSSSHPVGIGGYLRKLSGNIGSILIYNRQLSSSEILKNFQANRSRYGI